MAARVLLGNQLLYATLAPIPVLTQNAPASAIVVPVGEVPDVYKRQDQRGGGRL